MTVTERVWMTQQAYNRLRIELRARPAPGGALLGPTAWDTGVAPVALQRWESEGGACLPS
jgi:hypothetical protein